MIKKTLYTLGAGITATVMATVLAGGAVGVYAVYEKERSGREVFVEWFEPKPKEIESDLEGAITRTLTKIESCGAKDGKYKRSADVNKTYYKGSDIQNNSQYIHGFCGDSTGNANIEINDKEISFFCHGEECPTKVTFRFHEYQIPCELKDLPNCGPPEVMRTFDGVSFTLRNYDYGSYKLPEAIEVITTHPYSMGAMHRTQKMQAAMDRARTSLNELYKRQGRWNH